VDIANAKDYVVDRLTASKAAGHANCATDAEIASAEIYKSAVIFSHTPAQAGPPWLTQIANNIAQMTTSIVQLTNSIDRLPTLLANIQAGTMGPLLNPFQLNKPHTTSTAGEYCSPAKEEADSHRPWGQD
jgi:hypothetical protein